MGICHSRLMLKRLKNDIFEAYGTSFEISDGAVWHRKENITSILLLLIISPLQGFIRSALSWQYRTISPAASSFRATSSFPVHSSSSRDLWKSSNGTGRGRYAPTIESSMLMVQDLELKREPSPHDLELICGQAFLWWVCGVESCGTTRDAQSRLGKHRQDLPSISKPCLA